MFTTSTVLRGECVGGEEDENDDYCCGDDRMLFLKQTNS